MITVDQYSLASKHIAAHFGTTPLSQGTGFIWRTDAGADYLVTNWHVVSGRNSETKQHLSPATAAEPDSLTVSGFDLARRGYSFDVRLRGQFNEPMWLVHPSSGSDVDIAAIRIPSNIGIDYHPINRLEAVPMSSQVGMDLYILGFPYGISAGPFPVWKRGSFASEPTMSPSLQPYILVDTASRPGMSGAPVIQRAWGTVLLENGDTAIHTGPATKFIGIYSGRLHTKDPLDAQLARVWPSVLIKEIIAGARQDA